MSCFRVVCSITDQCGLDTPKTAASFLHAFIQDVLPFTDDASVVNGKTSNKSVQKRRGGFWCHYVKVFKDYASSVLVR